MENHFGKGLMAGLQASYADTAAHAANFCADYKRGFVLGYSHRMFEKNRRPPAQRLGSGDPHPSLWPGQGYGDGFLQRRWVGYGDALFSGGLSAGKLNRTASQAEPSCSGNPFPSTGKGEDLTPGAYLPFGCQSRGRHGAHAAAH